MESRPLKIRSISHLTHDVLKIVTGKPAGITFIPGQAAEISINKENWTDEKRPFTFTCLPDDDYLEFSIKVYADHPGVTRQLLYLKPGDELLLHDIFGTISYQGMGTFIAGGAGITPFISIFRELRRKNALGNNRLIFANKTTDDIILEKEFREMLGVSFINILSEEKTEKYAYGRISEDFLRVHMAGVKGKVYLCGPDPMIAAMEQHLANLGILPADIIKEEF